MNAKRFVNQYRRRVFLFILIIGLCGVGLFWGMRKISQTVDQKREEISTRLKEEIGFPIQYADMEVKWSGFSLVVSLKEAVIIDNDSPTPFISADAVDIFPSLTSLLFSKETEVYKIVLKDVKIVMGVDKENNLSILGVKSQNRSKTVDYPTLVAAFSKLDSIVLEGSEILWQGPHYTIKQKVDGTFQWVNSSEGEWTFKGSQQLQIRDGFFTPESRIHLAVAKNLQKVTVDLGSKSNQCVFQPQADQKNQPWEVQCRAALSNIDIAALHEYYIPTEKDLELFRWLTASLPQGQLSKGNIEVKGTTKKLQWQGGLHFDNVNFEFSKEWPAITKAAGEVVFDSNQATIVLNKGNIWKAPIKTASATVQYAAGSKSVAKIAGTVNSTLEKGLQFLQDSPLRHSIAEYLQPLNPKGKMQLGLNITIPLEDNNDPSVQGTVAVQDAVLDLVDQDFSLNDLNGDFHFTEAGITTSNAKMNWKEHPLDLRIKTTDKALEVTGIGNFSAEFLQKEFTLPILEKLKGQSKMSFTLRALKEGAEFSGKTRWIVGSDFEGMEVQLPSFLGKKAEEKRDTVLVFFEEGEENRIVLHVDKLFDAKLVMQGPKDNKTVKKAEVVFGNGLSDWPKQNSIFLRGRLAEFDVEDWLEFLDDEKSKTTQEWPTLNVNVLMDRLYFYGLKLNDIRIITSFDAKPSNFKFEGPTLSGGMIISGKGENSTIGIELNYLNIRGENILYQASEEDILSDSQHPINFYCKNLHYQTANFGEVSFKLVPRNYGYAIQNLSIENRHSELTGEGEWRLGQSPNTVLRGQIVGTKLGDLFSSWGFPSPIKEASGTIQYQLKWPKHPFQFSMGLVDGDANIKVSKGRILGVNPGLGRVLGLISIENIARRLTLDFSDVFKKGFVFDTMKGGFTFKSGVANTRDLSIKAPSADIELAGSANLKARTLDMQLKVSPHLGSGLPLAAGLLGGPAAFAGAWVVGKVTGMHKIAQHYYHVTGSFDQPHVQELGAKKSDSRSSRGRR